MNQSISTVASGASEISKSEGIAIRMRNISKKRDLYWQKNRAELGETCDSLNFVTDAAAVQARRLREEILATAGDNVAFHYKRTKPAYGSLSPGCKRCGNGSWSCLFISGKCNCRCFYCPAEQSRVGVPTTNTITFPKVQDYADYIEKLGFDGISISGGEPLLTPDTTIKFIAGVRKKMGDTVHIWMYTNGTLATPDLLAKLKDAGLNEIRFDIGATGYSLDKAALAVGLIEHVTVEIPAVPEDYALMTDKLREMSDRGISFLNLHQLRLTPYNLPNLSQRPYTYLHGEHVTVLESELTALKLMNQAAQNSLPLSVNYCSFVYKNRFQQAASRRRCGTVIRKSYEDLTENGYIRSLCIKGAEEAIGALAESLERSGAPADQWFLTKGKDRLFFSASLLDILENSLTDGHLFVAYFDNRLVSSVSYAHPFQEIPLNRKRTIFAERTRATEEIEIPPGKLDTFARILKNEPDSDIPDTDDTINRLLAYEFITPDLQDYV